MKEELQRKIDNRETELQQAFDYNMEEKARLEKHIGELKEQLRKAEDAHFKVRQNIELCYRRAEEQNAIHVL